MIYMDDYKIRLGVELDTSDIISEINKAESKVDPIKIKVDAETKELTKSIQDALKSLSKGTQNALTLDTTKVEGSLKEVTTIIKEIRTAMGSLDSGSGMKSLVGSINSISTALDKASNKFDELVSDLKSLSGKDFNLNFGINLGGSNPIARQSAYGNKARNDTLPQLKQQMNALVKYYNDIYKDSADEFVALQKLVSGTKLGTGDFFQSFLYGKDSVASRMGTGSLSSQMQAYKQYIDMFKQAASLKGLDLSSVTSQFSKSADQLIQDAQDIQSGAKEMDESFDKLKQIFSGGGNLNIQELSVQLDPIVQDLKQIREAVVDLSKGVSLEGLTGSFDRLSNAIENLLANAERVKGVLGSGFDVGKIGSTSATQQVGKKVGETVKQSVKQSLTLDDVIDEQVSNLMSQYGIKGKKAFEEIRQAVVEYRKELQLANNIDFTPNINDPFGFDDYGTSADIRKVIDTVTDNVGRVRNPEKEANKEKYEKVWDEIRKTNKDGKVTVPIEYKYEFPDDFNNMMRRLGKGFVTKQDGLEFDSWFQDLDDNLKETIIKFGDESNNIRDYFKNLSDIWSLRDSEPAFLRGDDILRHNDYGSIPNEIESAINTINQKELEFAQASKQTANTVSQSQEQIRQEYEETKRLRDEVDRAIDDYAERISNPDDSKGFIDIDELEEYRDKMVQLEQVRDDLATKMQSLESQLQGSDMSNNFKEVDIAIGNAEDEVSSLESALKKLGVSDNNIESITQEIKELGVTAKSVTATLGADDSISFSIKGIDEVKNAVALMNSIDADGNLGGFSQTVSQNVDEVADSFERLKAIAKEINGLNVDVIKLNDTDDIDRAKSKLEQLQNEYKELYAQSSGSLDNSQIKELDKIAEQGRQAIAKLKNELSEKISLNLGDDGKFATQVQKITTDAKQLSGVTDELQAQIRSLDTALGSMNLAKENDDVDGLISSWKEYKATLESVENQLKQLKIAQKDTNSADNLALDKEIAMSRLKSLFGNGSEAAKKFATEINRIEKEINECGNADGIRKINKEITNLGRQAEAASYKTETFGQKLKRQWQQYSAYFGVAEIFMWAEQGLRDMFEQVKLIDSAMTELKKVTDETDASYNQFLSNAASKAKELGTTIDGLVSSTADFARLGYGLEEAQGLAEVANIYAVVGDEIEGVEGATESLISTLAAFKSETSGISDADFAMDIIDKFNEVGNNFAISSGGIGEAMERSASSLMASNATLDEAIALITASNQVVQDPVAVGTAWKTISMRIRGRFVPIYNENYSLCYAI